MKKKIISVVLVFVLALNILPFEFMSLGIKASAVTYIDKADYNAYSLEYPLLTIYNKDKLKSYDASKSPLNYAHNMNSLATTSTTFFSDVGSDYMTYNFPSALKSLAESGQIDYAYCISMAPDLYSIFRHTNHLKTTIWAGGTKSLVSYNTDGFSSGEWSNYGNTTSFNKIPSYASGKIAIAFETYGSDKGTPRTSNMQLYLADTVAPSLLNAKIDTGNYDITNLNKKAGDSVQIVLTYDEPIRAANGFCPSSAVTLELELSYDNKNYTGNDKQLAYLTKVSGNELTFTYTVPQTIDGIKTDHVITGIKGSSDQQFYNGEYTLNYVYNDGEILSSHYFSDQSACKTSTMFTDLAGNPINEFDKITLNNQVGWTSTVKLDNQPPHITGVSTSASKLNITGPDNSRVFAGTGDVINFVATLNESAKYGQGAVIATLSLVDGTGKNVIISNSYYSDESKILEFEPLTITDDMILEQDFDQIVIKHIGISKDADILKLQDNSQNEMVTTFDLPISDEDLFLDVDAPSIEIDSANIYTNQDEGYIRVPATITDTGGSGIVGARGTYRLNIDDETSTSISYQVCINDSEVPDSWSDEMTTSSSALSGFKLPILDRQQYFHFKITKTPDFSIEKVNFELKVSDYAGNIAQTDRDIAFEIDKNSPTITFSDVSITGVENDNEKAKLSFTANISDVNEILIDEILFAEPENPDDFDNYTWGETCVEWDISQSFANEDKTEVEFDISGEFSAEYAFTKYFAVKATDKFKNSSISYNQIDKTNLVNNIISVGVTQNPNTQDQQTLQIGVLGKSNGATAGDSSFLLIEDPYNAGKYMMREYYYDVTIDENNPYYDKYADKTLAEFAEIDEEPTEQSSDEPTEPQLELLELATTKITNYQNALAGGTYDIFLIEPYYFDTRVDLFMQSGTDNDLGAGTYGDWWSYVEIKMENGQYTFVDLEEEFPIDTLKQIADANYYGTVKGKVFNGSQMLKNEMGSFNGSITTYDFSYRLVTSTAENENGDVVNTVPDVSITPIDWKLAPEDDWDISTHSDLDGILDPKYNASVDGNMVQIALNKTVPNWDVNLDVKSIEIKLIDITTSVYETVYSEYLPISSLQNFVIPADTINKSGHSYRIHVEVTANDPESITHKNYSYIDFEIQNEEIGDFGFDSVWHSNQSTLFTYNDSQEAKYDYGFAVDYVKGTNVLIGYSNDPNITKNTTVAFVTTEPENSNVSEYIKVWTEENDGIFVKTSQLTDEFYGKYGAEFSIAFDGANDENTLVLEKDKDNIVYYQMFNESGKISNVRTVIMTTSSEKATLEMGVTPEDSGEKITKAEAYVKVLSSPTITQISNENILKPEFVCGLKDLEYIDTIETTGGKTDNSNYKIENSGEYYFAVINPYGNLTITKLDIDHIDGTAPTLELGADHDRFIVKYTDNEDFSFEDISIYMKYIDDRDGNETYMKRLIKNGLEVNDDGYFKLELHDDTWAYTPQSMLNGIYSINTNDNNNEGISLYYEPFYDETKAENEVLCDYIYFYAIDKAGNISEPQYFDLNNYIGSQNYDYDIKNIKPTFESFEATLSQDYVTIPDGNYQNTRHNIPNVNVKFTQMVNLTSPSFKENSVRNLNLSFDIYSDIREGYPAYSNGDYTFKFTDIFGREYEETKFLNFFDTELYDYSLILSPQSEGIVNGSYSVHIDATIYGENKFWIHPSDETAPNYTFIPDDGSEFVGSSSYTSGTLVFFENGEVAVSVKTDDGKWIERVINCYNISETATVDTSYYYEKGSTYNQETGKTETYGDVIVTLKSLDQGRIITGDMQSLSHTFTYDDYLSGNTTHTFNFVDDQGNKGTYQATLDSNILMLQEEVITPVLDTVAPVYVVKTYGKYGGSSYNLIESFVSKEWKYNETSKVWQEKVIENTAFAQSISNIGYINGLMFEIAVSDESHYKTVLLEYKNDGSDLTYENATSADILGVTLKNGFITVIDPNATFAIAVIDESNNLSLVSQINGGFLFDNTAPIIEEYEVFGSGYAEAVVYLKVSDESDISVKYPTGVQLITDTNDQYFGYYKYIASSNGSFDIAFLDEAQNLSCQTVAVTQIDGEAPTATITRWTPSDDDTMLLPPTITNQNVTVDVAFDKFIKQLELLVYDDRNGYMPTNANSPVLVLFNDGERATVMFTENSKAMLVYTALNNQTNMIELDMSGEIDKIKPTVSVDKTYIYKSKENGSKYSAPIGVTYELYDPNGEIFIDNEVYTKDNPFTKTIYKNGEYCYKVFDSASNLTNQAVEITNLDEKAPEIKITEKSVASPNAEYEISVNEAGKFTLSSGLSVVSGNLVQNAKGKITVRATENGYYQVSFIDEAGRTTNQYLTVGTIDKTAPEINLLKTTAQVRQGTSASQLDLGSLIVVKDNLSSSENITVDIDDTNINLDIIGLYEVTVTATDESQNSTSRVINVNVFSKNQTSVSVNGNDIEPNSVAIIPSGTLELAVDLPEDFNGEPYKVYLANGYYKAGYMKTYSQKLDVIANSATTNVTANSWYTIYIVRQSREVFLAYVYVGQ